MNITQMLRNLTRGRGEQNSIEPSAYVEKEPHKIVPHSSDKLSRQYRQIILSSGANPQSILYPCCEADVTPSTAFPQAEVTYVDLNKAAIDALTQAGYSACYGRVPSGGLDQDPRLSQCESQEFAPKTEADLLILLNPQISPQGVVSWVRERGFVLCNNYHGTADEMYHQKDFDPLARLDIHTDLIDQSSLEGYFTLLTTDEEYLARNAEAYREIQRFIYGRFRTLCPRLFDVGHAIPPYLKQAKGCHEMFGSIFMNGKTLPKPFRVKPSNVDDLFLFQKKVISE